MSEPNWEIRVGGIYVSHSGSRRKVLALDGDAVHNVTLFPAGFGEATPHINSAKSFRQVHHPEDQSPLPAMTALLEKVVKAGERGELGPAARYLGFEAQEILARSGVAR